MLIVSRFVNGTHQSEKVQMIKPAVPNFWGGFYAIYPPKPGTSLWVKRWHKNKTGKVIKKATGVIDVTEAHQKWNQYLNNGCNEEGLFS